MLIRVETLKMYKNMEKKITQAKESKLPIRELQTRVKKKRGNIYSFQPKQFHAYELPMSCSLIYSGPFS